MAKDPATLWYWNDWHSGTVLLSRHLKGCYMDLLHAQFHHGPLSLEEIKAILGSDFGQAWPAIQKKFVENNGKFFNERLELEKENRKKHSFKQSKNASMRWHKSGNAMAYAKTMPLENENENKDDLKEGGVVETIVFPVEHCAFIALKDDRWREKANATDERVRIFNDHLIATGEHEKNPADYKKHFTNWWKKQKNEAHIGAAKSITGKAAGAYQLLSSLKSDLATGT